MLYQLPLCDVRIVIVRVSLGYEKLFYISFLEKSLQNTKVDFLFKLCPNTYFAPWQGLLTDVKSAQ
jgi:hypothetical protein